MSASNENKPGHVAGVDGCRAGWIVVTMPRARPDQATAHLFHSFGELLDAHPEAAIFAVDMPIGLPARLGREGRGPEKAVRALLGMRQSSVFSVPSRQAVMQTDYRLSCEIAAETSDPPRKVSKQCFYLFPKIREIDSLMTPQLQTRVYEVHPELAFWRLNNREAMMQPKKIKSRLNPAGLKEREDLLMSKGFNKDFFSSNSFKGAGRDDLLDAAANCLIAERIAQKNAEPFPKNGLYDEKGLRIAIWA